MLWARTDAARRTVATVAPADPGPLVARGGGSGGPAACHALGVAWLVSDAHACSPRRRSRPTRRATPAGLLHRDGLEGAFVITSCRWVHTVGMRFPLDVAYVDADGTVVKTVRMARHRIGWPVPKARG